MPAVLLGVKRDSFLPSITALLLALLLVTGQVAVAGLKPKKIKASANPPAYVGFSKPLSGDEAYHHALDRLTFGARPGDLDRLQRVGLEQWLNNQLHPEQVAENSALVADLAPYQTLQMGIRDTYINYPAPQMIAAVARGRRDLPDDPELRNLVQRLVARYLARKAGDASTKDAANDVAIKDANDLSDLDSKMKLADLLTPEQIEELHNGKPDQKRAVLASLLPEKRADFVWALKPAERQQLFTVAPVTLRRELMRSIQPQNVIANDLTEGKLLRATYSNHQLYELLADFWFNHFNVTVNKGPERYAIPTYERETIRPYVFGSFHDLLLQTAKSPAMLFYLDNWESVAADAKPTRNGKSKRGLNENYGRELLELHTLGVDGGYTQQDVIEVARCFTGWTIAAPRKGGGFEYNDKVHDKGRKLVLGHAIPPGGNMSDGLQVIDILSHHPSTAHFISLKLANRFVADDPPPSLVNRMSQVFMRSNGNLREVVRTMIESPEFWSQGAYNAKVKSPFEMIVSALRATNADISSALPLAGELQKLGEPLYRKIEPTGYSSSNDAWVSSAGLLERMNFGLALAHNRLPGITVDVNGWQATSQTGPMALAYSLLQGNPSAQTQTAIEKMLQDPDLQKQLASNAKAGPPRIPSLVAGLVLGSPEFQRR